MRTLIFLFSFTLATAGFAQSKRYEVVAGVCGEFDPYIIGDACLLEVTDGAESLLFLMDLDFTMDALGSREFSAYDLIVSPSALSPLSLAEDRVIGRSEHGLRTFRATSEQVSFIPRR